MVGIFKYQYGLKFKAVSATKESAKKALYERCADEQTKSLENYYIDCGIDYIERWWKNVGANCYEITEIEYW